MNFLIKYRLIFFLHFLPIYIIPILMALQNILATAIKQKVLP